VNDIAQRWSNARVGLIDMIISLVVSNGRMLGINGDANSKTASNNRQVRNNDD